jgi:polyisoprenoid-binding protein YceI
MRAPTSPPPPAPEPGEWTIDPANSSVSFAVRHMLVSRITGRFTRFTGHIATADDLDDVSVHASIDAASIDTAHPERDEHLRGARFLDAGPYPEIIYRSTGVRRDGDGYLVAGELTMKAITRPVELHLTVGGIADDPLGHRRAGFHATANFSRAAFGIAETMGAMPAGGAVIGDAIELVLDIEAICGDHSAARP